MFDWVVVSHFVYPFTPRWTFGLFPLLRRYGQGRVNVRVRAFAWIYAFVSPEQTWGSGIAESRGSSVFNLLRSFQTFPSGCALFHSHEERAS